MASLFIIYIPLEEVSFEVENSDLDQVDQGNGTQYVIESDARIDDCSDEGVWTGERGKLPADHEVETLSDAIQHALKQPNIHDRKNSLQVDELHYILS